MFRKTVKITTCVSAFLLYFFVGIASAQGTKTVAVKVSDKVQKINNKEYYVHIVEQGQTVFSIARAYGLKYYDAVIKTDIHLMKVGDTVWLPKNEYSVAAVSANANAVVSPTARVHYIKIESGQTLYSLSREYGVTVEQIVEANPELRTEQLKAGQMLKIPPKETEERKAESGERKAENVDKTRVETQQQAKQKSAEDVAKQKAAEDVAKQKAAEDVAKQKAAEEATKQKAAEESAKSQTNDRGERQNDKIADMDLDSVNPAAPIKRQVVNPYPFNEVPNDFPQRQASYYNFTTTSSFNYQVRDRQDKNRVYVSVVMPLNLDKINEISTSKFDIEQRGKKDYKVFEFIQFYEGILMALDEIQSRGIDVVLNVVDLSSDNDEDVERAYVSHNVANSDFIIALLVKKPFHKLAELAKQSQVFVINPFSSREDIIKDNPYVIKYMPSTEGTVKGILDIMSTKHKGGHLYVLHSNSKSLATDEKAFHDEFEKQLQARKDIKYTFFDWAANAKLLSTLKTTTDNVLVSIYNSTDKNKNRIFATTLLNRLSPLNNNVPTLITVNNYLTEYPNVDFEQLQHLMYTTVTIGYLNYDNSRHKAFIDTYKDKFHTEPNTLYAGVAHDIMLYFTTALSQQGAEFWRNPQKFSSPDGMLFPFLLHQSSSTGGYENQQADIYQMVNYKLVK